MWPSDCSRASIEVDGSDTCWFEELTLTEDLWRWLKSLSTFSSHHHTVININTTANNQSAVIGIVKVNIIIIAEMFLTTTLKTTLKTTLTTTLRTLTTTPLKSERWDVHVKLQTPQPAWFASTRSKTKRGVSGCIWYIRIYTTCMYASLIGLVALTM